MSEGNSNDDFICKVCRELGDPKLYMGLAIVVLATWDNLPKAIQASEWAGWLHSVLLYIFAGAGIVLRRPSLPTQDK